MTSLNQTLAELDRLLETALSGAGSAPVPGDDDAVQRLLLAGQLQRRLDGVITATAAHVVDREAGERTSRLTTRAGCRDPEELLERTLRIDRSSARRFLSAAKAIHRDAELTSGALLPSKYPQLAAALHDGHLSLTGFLACIAPLEAARSRISAVDVAHADRILARSAAGLDLDDPGSEADEAGSEAGDADEAGREAEDPRPAPTVEDLRLLSEHIAARVDPDGAEPIDDLAQRRRHLTLGRQRDGVVPLRGALLPDVAGLLQRLIDSVLNPRVDSDGTATKRYGVTFRPSAHGDASPAATEDGTGDGSHDDRFSGDGLPDDHPSAATADLRTHAQKRHDALATMLGVAAASDGMPTLGGAAPTLVVSVSAEDFLRGAGHATVEGVNLSVPVSVARHTACAGGVQRVLFDANGAITAIGTSARLFNAVQRRAIILRDRECVIFGCHVRAEWCEIHHVVEHARGGPTHTSNGVALCWHHHRTLDVGGWQIRMQDGVPEIRGPEWWDPEGRWRPARPPDRRRRRRPREPALAFAGGATAEAAGDP